MYKYSLFLVNMHATRVTVSVGALPCGPWTLQVSAAESATAGQLSLLESRPFDFGLGQFSNM